MIHRELTIISSGCDSRDLVEKIAIFTKAHDNYGPRREATAEYREAIEADSYVLCVINEEPFPSIHIASSDGASMQVVNIVPRTKSSLTIEEYNYFLEGFHRELSRFSRKQKLGLRLKLSSDGLSLEAAISGAKTRKMFERFLAAHPRSYHFNDVRRLDVFTITASNNPRGRVDVYKLERYLKEKLQWSTEDAEWCRKRITVGLEILQAKREY